MQEITYYFQPLSIFHRMEQTDSGLKVEFYSYRVKHDQMNSNSSPEDFYPGLILFWPALPSDLNVPAESPSDEASIDFVKELERSA